MADTSSDKKYQRFFIFTDKRFDVAALPQYHLSIYINNQYIKVGCVNPTTKQCLFIEQYKLAHQYANQRIQAMGQLYQDHPILGRQGWSAVTLCVGNQQYTLVPQSLFQEKQITDYLYCTCPIGSNVARHFTHVSFGTTVAFAIDPLLLNWFQATYKNTQLHTIHQASSLIQGTWTYVKSKKSSALPKVTVFVEPSNLHITVIQENKLVYYNRFAYTTCDELLYYILIVMHTLQLDTSSHEVILGGHIRKRSSAYRKVRHYIRRVTLMGKLPYLKFSKNFPPKVMTTYLDVLSMHLC